jgi:O-antigen ligase
VSAHSGPLEWAVELGVPGALAWLAVLAGAAVATLRARPAGAAALAGLPALAAVGVQGAVDPGPQVPAAALTAALLVGLALARPRV